MQWDDYIIRICFILSWLIISFFCGLIFGIWIRRNDKEFIRKSIEDNWREIIEKRIK